MRSGPLCCHVWLAAASSPLRAASAIGCRMPRTARAAVDRKDVERSWAGQAPSPRPVQWPGARLGEAAPEGIGVSTGVTCGTRYGEVIGEGDALAIRKRSWCPLRSLPKSSIWWIKAASCGLSRRGDGVRSCPCLEIAAGVPVPRRSATRCASYSRLVGLSGREAICGMVLAFKIMGASFHSSVVVFAAAIRIHVKRSEAASATGSARRWFALNRKRAEPHRITRLALVSSKDEPSG